MKKNFIFYIHSFAGLVSGLFILLMSLSGAVLVFHDDIDSFQQPVFRVKDYNNLAVDSAYNNLRQRFPNAQISSCRFPANKKTPFAFSVYEPSYKEGKKSAEIFIHPQTGGYLGIRGGSDDMKHNFMSWLAKFHNSFHLGKTGEWLLGFFALIFLLSLITGFILFRKNILSVLLFKKAVYKRGNLHQLIGVYALIFNLMIAVTGFWMQRYVFKKEFYAVDNYAPVFKASPAFPFKFDSAFAQVKKAYPDFTAAVIYFAQSSSGKTAVYGSRASNAYIHSKKFSDVIMLDSAGGIAKTRMINENSADDKYDIINSQLHMGKYGGVGIKIIYFIFGLSGGLLSITGFLLWWRRRRS
ncbi:MAG: PepSY domain-containing protein [Chitinophagaceae bacterium]|nr:PepSY domain-containing protein [Chitinophagaceae bacterium]